MALASVLALSLARPSLLQRWTTIRGECAWSARMGGLFWSARATASPCSLRTANHVKSRYLRLQMSGKRIAGVVGLALAVGSLILGISSVFRGRGVAEPSG